MRNRFFYPISSFRFRHHRHPVRQRPACRWESQPQEPGTELIPDYPEYKHLAKTWSAVPDGAHWAWEAGFKEIKAPEEGGPESVVKWSGSVSAIDFDEEQARDRRLLKKMLKVLGFTDPGDAKGLGQAEMVYTACNKTSNTAEDLKRRHVGFVYMSTYLM
ncbi:hypothetical protein J3F84DRAFT_401271 [Trichoderma pleuroticola]